MHAHTHTHTGYSLLPTGLHSLVGQWCWARGRPDSTDPAIKERAAAISIQRPQSALWYSKNRCCRSQWVYLSARWAYNGTVHISICTNAPSIVFTSLAGGKCILWPWLRFYFNQIFIGKFGLQFIKLCYAKNILWRLGFSKTRKEVLSRTAALCPSNIKTWPMKIIWLLRELTSSYSG